jgi:integrase
MSAVERPRPGVERVTPTLTVEEVDRLAAACDRVSRRYGDYVRLAALLGLRAGELTALQVGEGPADGHHARVQCLPSGTVRWARSRRLR